MRPFVLAALAVALPGAVAVMDFSTDANAAPLCKAPGVPRGCIARPVAQAPAAPVTYPRGAYGSAGEPNWYAISGTPRWPRSGGAP